MRNEKIRATPDGRIHNRKSTAERRATEKTEYQEKLERFPPDLSDKVIKDCVRNYINATSAENLKTVECGICAEAIKDNCDSYVEKAIEDIPGRNLLS